MVMTRRETTAVLWPDPDRGPYLIRLEATPFDGRLQCSSVEVRAMNGKPVTATALRAVPLGRLMMDFLERRAKEHMPPEDIAEWLIALGDPNRE